MKSLVFVLSLIISTSALAKGKLHLVCDEDQYGATLIDIPTKAQQKEAANAPVVFTASFDGDLVLSTLEKPDNDIGNEYDCTYHDDESTPTMAAFYCEQDGYSDYKKMGLPRTIPAKGQAFKVPFVDVMFETEHGPFGIGSHETKKVVKSVSTCVSK